MIVFKQSKLGSRGSDAYEWIINGINYAVNNRGPNGEKVRVISMSLGGPENGGRYAELKGTATPHISGGAALIIKHFESKNDV
ncbi:hypothetical protein AB0N28_31505 [Streptomyces sp. NPDC051130]|uniref:hypothetical protein n=1 Tax=Streptomyces sp. NPDC051130 TaxID=3157223 RepID=UPI00342AC3B9